MAANLSRDKSSQYQDRQELGGSLVDFANSDEPLEAANDDNTSLGRPVDYATFEKSAQALRLRLRQNKIDTSQLPATALQSSLESSRGVINCLVEFVLNLNALPGPSSDRDPKIGQVILPLVVRALADGSRTGNEPLLFDLYCRTHIEPKSLKPQVTLDPSVLGLQRIISVKPHTSELPEIEPYLDQSESLKGALAEIRSRMAEKQVKIADFEKKGEQARANSRSGKDPYADITDKLRAEKAAIATEIPALLPKLTDVRPEDVPECLNGVGMKASISTEALTKIIAFTKSLETLLVASLTPPTQEEAKPFVLETPQFGSSGKLENDRIALSSGERASIAADPQVLSLLIHTYLDSRQALRKLMPTLSIFPALTVQNSAVLQVLRQPFAHLGAKGHAAYESLFAKHAPEAIRATLELITTPISSTTGSKGSWGHVLENQADISPLIWVVEHYLRDSHPDGQSHFLKALQQTPALRDDFAPFARKIKALMRSEDLAHLATAFVDKIAEVHDTTELFSALGPIVVLPSLIAEKNFREQLKKQIPNVPDLHDIAKNIALQSSPLKVTAATLAKIATKALSVSMSDFYRGPGMEELWEFIDEYKIFLANPEMFQGLAGNEGMRSGVLVAGEFGVGKTFFVTCLAQELEVKLFKVAPDKAEASSPKMMLDAARKTIKEAKEYAKSSGPCILFLDEAESLMANRANSTISQDQADLTCFLLQEINEIRLNHPKILLVAATNYPDKIDEGMMRDGRFDVHVYMGPPSDTMRQDILEKTLISEGVAAAIGKDQIKELVKMTDGLMPLPIKRAIISLNRLGKTAAEASGKKFEFTYEGLRGKIKAEQERKALSLVKRMADAKQERLAARKKADESEQKS